MKTLVVLFPTRPWCNAISSNIHGESVNAKRDGSENFYACQTHETKVTTGCEIPVTLVGKELVELATGLRKGADAENAVDCRNETDKNGRGGDEGQSNGGAVREGQQPISSKMLNR